MKLLTKVTIGTLSLGTLLISAAIVQAGGWDNFKLRHYALT